MNSRGSRALDLTAARDYDLGLHQRGERGLHAQPGTLEYLQQPTGTFVPMRRSPAFLREKRVLLMNYLGLILKKYRTMLLALRKRWHWVRRRADLSRLN